jgi:hypothetical protein
MYISAVFNKSCGNKLQEREELIKELYWKHHVLHFLFGRLSFQLISSTWSPYSSNAGRMKEQF